MKTCENCNFYVNGACQAKVPMWAEELLTSIEWNGNSNPTYVDPNKSAEHCWRYEIKKLKKPPKTKELCSGCDNNFYNGNNPIGVYECWSYKAASVIIRKEVGINNVPPWDCPGKYFMSCYSRKGYVYVKGRRKTW